MNTVIGFIWLGLAIATYMKNGVATTEWLVPFYSLLIIANVWFAAVD